MTQTDRDRRRGHRARPPRLLLCVRPLVLLLGAIVSSLAGGCGSGDPAPRPAGAQPQGPPPTSVILGTVVERSIRPEIRVIGTVEPDRQTTVGAEVAGVVERFDLREGDRTVRNETIIAQLRTSDREIALREAAAALARAEAEREKLRRGYRPEEIGQRRAEVRERRALMEQGQKDLERSRDLHDDGAISIQQLQRDESVYLAARSQYDRALAFLAEVEAGYRQEDVAKAEAEFHQAQATRDRIQDELAKTTILSPLTGYLVKKHVEAGQWVDKGGRVADLVDLTTVRIVILIAERDIGQVRIGDTATIVVDAYPGRTFTGRVSHIVPQADLQSRAFPVKIEVENPAGAPLRGGMLARTSLGVGSTRPTVLIPKDAVVRRGDRELVFLVNGQTAVQREVSTGRAFDGFLELVEGDLRPGEPLVVTGNEGLRDGAPVMAVKAGAPAQSGPPGAPGGRR